MIYFHFTYNTPKWWENKIHNDSHRSLEMIGSNILVVSGKVKSGSVAQCGSFVRFA